MSNPHKTVASQLVVLFKLAFPIILGNFAYAVLNITDVLMAGMAGTPDQAGVAVGGSFFYPAMTFVIGMISALHPVISHHCGANTKERIPQTLAHAIIACLGFALVIMVILLVLALFFLEMDADQRMEDVSRYYVVCVAFTVPITAIYNSSRAYCEAMGNTRATLYFGLLAVVLNVPLNYCFIFGKFGLPALGGIGCGVATVISMLLSTVILFLYIRVKPQLWAYFFLQNTQGINRKGVWDYIKLSLPLGVSTSVESSCFALIALLLSPLGPVNVSAHTIPMSLTSFVFNIPLSVGIASAIMIGYALGQGNLQTLRLNIKAIYTSTLICFGLSFLIIFFGRHDLPRLFSTDPEVLALASTLMLFAAVNLIVDNLQTLQFAILRGFKDSKAILVITVIAFYVVALPLGISLCYGYIELPIFVTLFGEQGLQGPRGFWVALFCGLAVASALSCWRVFHHFNAIKAELKAQAAAAPTDANPALKTGPADTAPAPIAHS